MTTKTAKRKKPTKVRGVYEKVKGSNIWWICYKQGSVRKREKVGARGAAIKLYHKRKTELLEGKKLPQNLRKRGVTFEVLAGEAETWSEENHPKDIRTVKGRMKVLVAEFGDQTAASIEAHQIDQWLTENTQWSPATKNRYRSLLSLVYRRGMFTKQVTSNPAKLVPKRTETSGRVRFLEDHEETALRKVMEKRYALHIPALDVALYTGMRKSEQFSLTWDSIDLPNKKIHLHMTKNGSSRTIPIHPKVAEAFKTIKAASPKHKKTDRVFKTSRGEPLNNPRKWFETAIEEAKIENFRWHDCRHTFCSRLAMANVPLLSIGQLAGHKSTQVTKRYSHLSSDHNQSEIEKLG
jgi:integrase